MRLAYDLSILRHPSAGTARYAVELLRAMSASAGGDTIVGTRGWPRGARGGSLFRRAENLISDLGWLTIGAPVVAARHRVDAWFGPANVLPLRLMRPCVVTIHDANFLTARGEYDAAFVAYATRMYRLAGRSAAAVLTQSEFSRDRLVSDLGITDDQIVVANPGIDHTLRVEPAPADPARSLPYALFVGQTEPHKNIVRLVDAWAESPSDLDLLLVGPPGRDEVRLTERIRTSPVRRRIHRIGGVDDARLARLYIDATCFVFPSLTEGFGMPPLEAMARGIPTAVADAGALPEVTGDAAIRFDPRDPASIAQAVTRLVEDNELRGRLAAAGPVVAGRYRWRYTAETAWRVVRWAQDSGGISGRRS